MNDKMKYNIGDLFLSGGNTLLYISSYIYGPSELLNEGENGAFYKIIFLNGKPMGKSTWVLEEKITKHIEEGAYIYIPVKNEI